MLLVSEASPRGQVGLGTLEQDFAVPMLRVFLHGGAVQEIPVDIPPIGIRSDEPVVPVRVDRAQAAQIQPQRESGEPPKVVFPFVLESPELGQSRGVLFDILRHPGTQPVAICSALMVEQRIVFMVAHDGLGVVVLDHVPHNLEDARDPRAAVDEVAEEQSLPPLGVVPDSLGLLVAELAEQCFERIRVAVDVADDVVGLVVHFVFHGIIHFGALGARCLGLALRGFCAGQWR